MGIESDHLVYEYLSRVGDLAQRRQLSSGDRMRLVSGLRDEIDRRRAKYDPETPAAVRRVLERIGTPEEVLDTLGTLSGPGSGSAPAPAPVDPGPVVPGVPEQRGPGRLRRKDVPPPRPAAEPGNVPPHLAGLDELGESGGAEPDWWRMSPGTFGAGPQVEGFAGGIEIPDLFKEGPEDDEEARKPAPAAPEDGRGRSLVRFLRERRRAKKEAAAAAPEAEAAQAAAARPRPNAFLLLAAAVLVAGVISGYWLLLVVGWLLPYASRVLGPAERKWAVFGPPGAVLLVAGVWLWGRTRDKWGESLPQDQLSGALHGMWPWLLRAAALASVLYLVWRARRR
uniref:Integral membrane protein n=1 Tax=Streptomyces sp. NBC_00049 TaxID=2903617 RepID=A0AAU2JNU5_9ACTN